MSAAASAFVPPVRPEECVCDPLTYMDPNDIPPVCGEFATSSSDGCFDHRQCIDCGHDFECHKVQK